MPVLATRDSGRASFAVELERDALLPGTLARGLLHLTARDRIEARGVVAALVATEHWQWERTTTDANGRSQTETVTERRELRRLPVRLLGPTLLQAGARHELPLELPVPPLGPATVDATVAGLRWDLEAKVDIPGGFDSSIVVPVRVLQPTALLRAGVVRVAPLALFEAAEAATDGARAELSLEPMPLCIGEPFEGELIIHTDRPLQLQEIRLELRVKVRATVAGGRSEEVTVWVDRLTGAGELRGEGQAIRFAGRLPMRDLPTVELPHGRTDAQFRVVLARAWARDPNLVRDVAICSTREI